MQSKMFLALPLIVMPADHGMSMEPFVVSGLVQMNTRSSSSSSEEHKSQHSSPVRPASVDQGQRQVSPDIITPRRLDFNNFAPYMDSPPSRKAQEATVAFQNEVHRMKKIGLILSILMKAEGQKDKAFLKLMKKPWFAEVVAKYASEVPENMAHDEAPRKRSPAQRSDVSEVSPIRDFDNDNLLPAIRLNFDNHPHLLQSPDDPLSPARNQGQRQVDPYNDSPPSREHQGQRQVDPYNDSPPSREHVSRKQHFDTFADPNEESKTQVEPLRAPKKERNFVRPLHMVGVRRQLDFNNQAQAQNQVNPYMQAQAQNQVNPYMLPPVGLNFGNLKTGPKGQVKKSNSSHAPREQEESKDGEYSEQLNTLDKMGYKHRELNISALKKFDGDLDKALEEILMKQYKTLNSLEKNGFRNLQLNIFAVTQISADLDDAMKYLKH